MADHVHMLLNVPPKIAVSSVVGYIKGKSAIHIARHFMKRERNYAGQVFWARGYFVDTVGRDTETIRRYIADQEKEDQRLDQLEMPWIESQTNANKKN
jgi:putative transposase